VLCVIVVCNIVVCIIKEKMNLPWLIIAILGTVSLMFTIISLATAAWIVVGSSGDGLWQSCFDSACFSVPSFAGGWCHGFIRQRPSLQKNFGGDKPCCLLFCWRHNVHSTVERPFCKIVQIGGTLWNWFLTTPMDVWQLVVYTCIQWCYN